MAVTFILNTPEWMADPYTSYRELREQDPIHWSEPPRPWVLTRYAAVASVLQPEPLSAPTRTPPSTRPDHGTGTPPATPISIQQIPPAIARR